MTIKFKSTVSVWPFCTKVDMTTLVPPGMIHWKATTTYVRIIKPQRSLYPLPQTQEFFNWTQISAFLDPAFLSPFPPSSLFLQNLLWFQSISRKWTSHFKRPFLAVCTLQRETLFLLLQGMPSPHSYNIYHQISQSNLGYVFLNLPSHLFLQLHE